MSLYADLAADLSTIFANEPFVDALITRPVTETFDPRQRKTIKGDPVTVSCRAVLATVNRTARDGTAKTETIVTMNVEPRSGDKVIFGTSTWTVSDVSSESPAGVPLVFYATVSR